MATTEITVAAFQTACAECADAIAAENWGSAAKWYARAEAINHGLDRSAADGSQSFERRDAMNGLRSAIETAREILNAENRTGGFITTKTGFGS